MNVTMIKSKPDLKSCRISCTMYVGLFSITAPVSEFVKEIVQHLHSLSVVLQLGIHQRRELAHLLYL